MRLTILTRASDLARLQGHIVKRRLEQAVPRAHVTLTTRDSAGDRDRQTPLWQLGDKGAFTADLSSALARGEADIVVHSWKDLPIEPRPDTVIAATLPREDPRDVLLVSNDAVSRRAATLKVLSSSPRRALMLGEMLQWCLPWRADGEFVAVRGNVPTRLRHLIDGQGDALVVAKAALDRLLDPDSPFGAAAAGIRDALDRCRWIVLPLREHPSAAAQGALALEVAASNTALLTELRRLSDAQTWTAVTMEREILSSHGGGCAQAIGATVLMLPAGQVISVRGRTDAGATLEQWTMRAHGPAIPRATSDSIWPRPGETAGATRHVIDISDPADDRALYVTRADALPQSWNVGTRVVWAAGSSTWRKLAARGVWVNGSAEGLGHFDPAVVDRLAGRTLRWYRLTHSTADVADALPTYEVALAFPADIGARTHFFWGSGSEYRKAIALYPAIRDRWHGCGPGHTFDVVQRLSGGSRVRAYLGYDEWLQEITG